VGAVALEGDLHATQDGVVVVSHDATVDRTTDGDGYIKDLTLEELNGLDAGYRFTPDGGITYPYRGKGAGIPTLEEVFSDPVLKKTPMILEIKQQEPSMVDDVLDLIQAHDMEDRLTLGSFRQACLEEVRVRGRQRGMNIVTSLAAEEVVVLFLTPLDELARGDFVPPGELLQVPVEHELEGTSVQVVSELFMAKARVLGLKVQVWTVNEPAEMRWLADEMKVDGVMTDDPQLLEEVIKGP
jgi:glycerophosphoryl diester phosphodiesterase